MLPASIFPLAGQFTFGQNSCDASFSDFVLVIHHSLLIDALFQNSTITRPPVKGVLPKLEAEKKFNLHKEAALKAGLALRTDLHIVGPPEFMRSTYRVLDELKDKAPDRYQEVMCFAK